MTHLRRACRFVLIAAAAFAGGQGLLNAAAPPDGDSKPAQLKPLARVSDFSEWVSSVAWAPNGQQLAAGTYESVRIIDPQSKKVVATLPCGGFARAVAYSPDGELLAVGGYQSIELWDAASREKKGTLSGNRGYVTSLAFSADGKVLASSSEDETARVWNVADQTEAAVLRGHSYPVQGIAISPDGKFIATAAGDETRVTRPGEVKIWDAATGQPVRSLTDHEKAALCVAFSPDGKRVISGGADDRANVHEVETGKALGYFAGHGRPVNAAHVLASNDSVISVSGGSAVGGNDVRIWMLEDGTERAVGSAHEGRVTSLAVSPDGKTLATGGYDKAVFLWDVAAFAPQGEPVAIAAATEDEKKPAEASAAGDAKEIRVGIIGLDTSHAIAFAKALNVEPTDETKGVRVTVAYPKGSWDIESSVSRIPQYTEDVKGMGIEIVDSVEAVLSQVDAVLLETNDGRPHLEQAIEVFKAKKPVFIDKPLSASLPDAIAIYMAAEKYGTPMFSSSSLRYADGAQKARKGEFGEVLGCSTYSPCHLEKTHPDLYWYGMHGIEALYTVMGTGCETVVRTSTPDFDHVVGTWKGGRIGTFRGIRGGKSSYGGTVFGTEGIGEVGPYSAGYKPLLIDIIKFFRTGEPPVAKEETIELYTFMEAADESKRRGGVPVSVKETYDLAEKMAKAKLSP